VSVQLRKATVADAPMLREWDRRPHVRAAVGVIEGRPETESDWEWETQLPIEHDWREFLIAELDGVPFGFMQIIDPAREEAHYWGDVEANLRAIDVWIGPDAYLGRGLGTRMMRLALARCFGDPAVDAVIIDPLARNTRSHRFYERLGFRFTEERHFGDDDCRVYRLERRDWRP
jgi:aminoglycoside 6'-N-acetyltransferase